jgi:hypothetical protein
MIWVEVSAAFSKASQNALTYDEHTTQMCNALTMAPMPALLWYLHMRSGGLALLACAVTAQVLCGRSTAFSKATLHGSHLGSHLGSSIAYDTPLM